MNYKLFLSFTLLVTFILGLITYKSSFSNGKPHCSNFVTNVYLYLACALSLIACLNRLYSS